MACHYDRIIVIVRIYPVHLNVGLCRPSDPANRRRLWILDIETDNTLRCDISIIIIIITIVPSLLNIQRFDP